MGFKPTTLRWSLKTYIRVSQYRVLHAFKTAVMLVALSSNTNGYTQILEPGSFCWKLSPLLVFPVSNLMKTHWTVLMQMVLVVHHHHSLIHIQHFPLHEGLTYNHNRWKHRYKEILVTSLCIIQLLIINFCVHVKCELIKATPTQGDQCVAVVAMHPEL